MRKQIDDVCEECDGPAANCTQKAPDAGRAVADSADVLGVCRMVGASVEFVGEAISLARTYRLAERLRAIENDPELQEAIRDTAWIEKERDEEQWPAKRHMKLIRRALLSIIPTLAGAQEG